MATVFIINPSGCTYDLIVGRLPVHIPACRFKDNPAEVRVRDDLVPALEKSIAKRRPLRIVHQEVASELPRVEEPARIEEPEIEAPTDRAVFFASTKASKKSDGVWALTLSDGQEMIVEADHHLKAKEIAFALLHGAAEVEPTE